MLCDDVEGEQAEDGGGYVYLQLIHAVVQKKLTQHCKKQLYSNVKKNLFFKVI